MNKLITLILLSSITHTAFGFTTISIIGPCQDKVLYTKDYDEFPSDWTVGDISLDFYTELNINYQGTREGIQQLINIPSKENELIILSNKEMLAYGWCYQINGEVPEEYPHKIPTLPGDQIVWFFAYSRYLEGKWVSQCEPSFRSPRPEFCEL